MNALRSLSLVLSFATPFLYAYLALGAFARIVIWSLFGTDSKISLQGLMASLSLGMLNDSIELLYISLPLVCIFCLIPSRVLAKRLVRTSLGVITFIVVFAALFIAIAEVLFWEEFESRFNLIAVDYLIYPTEVVGNIQESYPLPALFGAITTVALLCWLPLWRKARVTLVSSSRHSTAFLSRLGALTTYGAMLIPISFIVSSDTFSRSSNRATNELTENGIATFFRAALTQEINYHQFYKSMPSNEAFSTVRKYYESIGESFVTTDARSLVRHHPANATNIGKLNVVILVQESLGAQFVGAYGDTRGLTPHLDALSKESLMFRNAYATGTRTVRGLEAMTASFPPIPSESIVKRPGSDHITTLGSIVRRNGYTTSFLYGGYGAFDNMNAYFGSNDFILSDRLDIKNPSFGNIWGVSDQDLYHHAIQYLDGLANSSDSPFLSVVLSTSNHKPFTFPSGIPGIQPKGGGREAGIKYADYAINEFFKEAKTKPWFSNTLFVVIADHDSRVYGRAYVPVEHYRIPALFYSPGHLTPAVNEKVFSSLDLAPTILGLLGIEYDAPFYGVDVLRPSIPTSRPVMFSHNHNIAWYQDEKLTVLGLGKETHSFTYQNGKTTNAPTDEEAGNLLAAHLQSAYELFKEHRY